MLEVWFWQRILSPHMAGLAVALAPLGCKVTYVAEQAMSDDRTKQGWVVPVLPGVDLVYAANSAAIAALVCKAPVNSVHICQGIRANGLIATAQRALAARGLRQWVVMETVNDAHWYGALKRAEYRRLFYAHAATLQGVLATGHRTAEWVALRGVPADSVFPFAYFLPDQNRAASVTQRASGAIRFLFAGQLIPRKRVEWLISALAGLKDQAFELWIVGTGSEEPALRALADVRDADSVRTAMRGVDYVFHAAALKQVPSCEFYPLQAVKTNVLGTENVLEAAITYGVKRVICLSTDKAVYPINAMGISKAMMEKVAVAKSRESDTTTICVTRYGNVMASRGSVIPLFVDQIRAGQAPM